MTDTLEAYKPEPPVDSVEEYVRRIMDIRPIYARLIDFVPTGNMTEEDAQEYHLEGVGGTNAIDNFIDYLELKNFEEEDEVEAFKSAFRLIYQVKNAINSKYSYSDKKQYFYANTYSIVSALMDQFTGLQGTEELDRYENGRGMPDIPGLDPEDWVRRLDKVAMKSLPYF